jgi:vacuolar-type H+-ATPase subunit E/Vma4
MQISVVADLRNVPERADVGNIADQLGQLLRRLTGANVKIVMNDMDSPGQWDRLNVLRELNRGIPMPGQRTQFTDDLLLR